MPQIISANRLSDGIVVFLDQHGQWVESLRDGRVFADAGAAKIGLARAEADVQENSVIEVAAIEVTVTTAGVAPAHLRDRIRAAGPTVRLDHGKQAG